MPSSWQVSMADVPAEIEMARLLVVPFCGLSMVAADNEYEKTFWAVVGVDDGKLPVEVTPAGFVRLAGLAEEVHEHVLVLVRTASGKPFDVVGLFSRDNALQVAEAVSRQVG